MTESTTNYRRLGRNGTSGYGIKSFSNFFLLLSAVVLVSLLYLYFSTSGELQAFRNDYEDLNAQHLKLKNELLDVNLKLESSKKSESECKTGKEALDSKFQTCQKDLSAKTISLAQIGTQNSDCAGTVNELKEKLESAKSDYETKAATNQNQIAELTQKIEQLDKQMEMARSATITSTPAQLQAGQDVNTLPPPKDITPKSKDSPHEADGAHEKQSADFIAPRRSPGGRVQLAEQAEQREKDSNHKELLKAAAKLDKQQEEETFDEAVENNDKAPSTTTKGKVVEADVKTATEKSRPLVDALHGIVA